jgi:hypothetical protein
MICCCGSANLATDVAAVAEYADVVDQGSWRIDWGYLGCTAVVDVWLPKSHCFCGVFFDIQVSICRLRRGNPAGWGRLWFQVIAPSRQCPFTDGVECR